MLEKIDRKELTKMYNTCRLLETRGYQPELWKDFDDKREALHLAIKPWRTINLLHVRFDEYVPDENDERVKMGEPVCGIVWKDWKTCYEAEVKEDDFVRLLQG